METEEICPHCERIVNQLDVYCPICGVNMRKYHSSYYEQEPSEAKHKDKKGSFERNFMRGTRK